MEIFRTSDFAGWDRFYRANFLNSLSGFKPVSLIGTIDRQGGLNLGLFSNIVHLGADPALVGFVNRPREAAPHTLANIEATGMYTINHVQPGILGAAHQASAKYPEGVSEFAETGLTPEYLDGFAAPFVRESHVKYALELQQVIPIDINHTFLVIGRVLFAGLATEWLQPDGYIDLQQAGSVCSAGMDGYYTTALLGRYRYARPGTTPEKIEF